MSTTTIQTYTTDYYLNNNTAEHDRTLDCKQTVNSLLLQRDSLLHVIVIKWFYFTLEKN